MDLTESVRRAIENTPGMDAMTIGELGGFMASARNWQTNRDIKGIRALDPVSRKSVRSFFSLKDQERLLSSLIKSVVIKRAAGVGSLYATRSSDPEKDIFDAHIELLQKLGKPENLQKAEELVALYEALLAEAKKNPA